MCAIRAYLALTLQKLGTFDGTTIWRNKMCQREQIDDGYLSIFDLIQPGCVEVIASTFCADPILLGATPKEYDDGWYVPIVSSKIVCRLQQPQCTVGVYLHAF